MPYFLLSFLLVVLDQTVKIWVVNTIPLYDHVEFIPRFMSLTYVQNTGAAFSMLSQHTSALTLVSGILSIGIALALHKNLFSRPLGKLSLSLVLAGAVGNLIDRGLRGFVVDMFHLLFMKFAVFNVADVCVVLGGILAAYYYLRYYETYDMPPEEKDEKSGEETQLASEVGEVGEVGEEPKNDANVTTQKSEHTTKDE